MGFAERDFTSQHLAFEPDPTYTGTTGRWDVKAVRGSVPLGTIKWKWAWRRFVFWPDEDTLYDASCLDDIVGFIKEKMELYKVIKICPVCGGELLPFGEFACRAIGMVNYVSSSDAVALTRRIINSVPIDYQFCEFCGWASHPLEELT